MAKRPSPTSSDDRERRELVASILIRTRFGPLPPMTGRQRVLVDSLFGFHLAMRRGGAERGRNGQDPRGG